MSTFRLSPKLRLASLWPALAAVITATALLASLVPRLLQQSAAEHLQASLDILLPLVEEQMPDPQEPAPAEDLQAWLRRLAAASDLRITVVALDGTVLADSARSREQVGRMDDHAARPEVVAALRQGHGVAVRRSDTTDLQYVYAARRVDGPDGSYLLRLAQPLRAVEALRSGLAGTMALAAVTALLVMAAISWWLDRRLFRPLARLIADAGRIAHGDYRHRVEEPEEDEVAQLALALNHLAQRVEDQLQEISAERDHLSTILGSMSEGVLVVDREGRAHLANPSFYQLLEVRDPVFGKMPLEVTRRVELASLVEHTLAGGGVVHQEITLRRPHRRTLSLSSVALAGREGGAVVVVRDTTESTRLGQVRRDFVANVSHELRTPLAAIRAYAETLRDGALDDPQTAGRFTERILDQSQRLQALLTDLLTLSKLESVDLPPRRDPVDLARAVGRAAEVVTPRAQALDVSLDVEAAETARVPAVAGEAASLERMLVNLLENAVKYNRPGGRVHVRLSPAEGPQGRPEVLLEVEDDGIGIPADALPRIFERFYRVDKGRSRDEGGTGLGLAIVKHVVQSHDGRIEVESEPGAGTLFRVHLPALPPDAAQTPSSS